VDEDLSAAIAFVAPAIAGRRALKDCGMMKECP
jgi:hypothetical protein